jgi:hypothetical protein
VSAREWSTAVATGLLRIVAGAALLKWRRPLAVRLAGADPGDRVVPLLFGYFGVRDLTVGVVTLASTRPDGDVARAVRLQGIADTTDAAIVAGVAARGHIPRERGVAAGVVAVGTAVAEFATAWKLRRTG